MKSIELPEGWLKRQMEESHRFWDSLGPTAQAFLEPLKHLNAGLQMKEPETKQPDELWEIRSLRPFGDQPKAMQHVHYSTSKKNADEYAKWVNDKNFNRGTVQSVTQYLRAGSQLTPSMGREAALQHLNVYLQHIGVRVHDIQHPEELQYVRWLQTFGNTAGPFGGVGGQMMTQFLMEAWVWDIFAVIFCNGKKVKMTDSFNMGVSY